MGLGEELLKQSMRGTRDLGAALRLGQLLKDIGFDPHKPLQLRLPMKEAHEPPEYIEKPKTPRKPRAKSLYIQKKLFE